MEDGYATVSFRTSAGIKKVRIRKGTTRPEISVNGGIKTGILLQNAMGIPSLQGPVEFNFNNVQGVIPGIVPANAAPQRGKRDRININADGIEIPDIPMIEGYVNQVNEEAIKDMNIKYPLIPRNPSEGRVMAYAHIFYSNKLSEPVYLVGEPKMEESDVLLLNEMKEYIQEKLDINFLQLNKSESMNYIVALMERAFDYFKIKNRNEKRELFKYYMLRDFIGLGKIEPLMHDKEIEDISCDGIGIPIYIYHRNPLLGSLRTNIKFSSQDELDSFVNKLSERCGKTISVAKPLLDGSLPGGSRIQATLGSDIARRGSNFTIRMFTEKPLTPIDMIKYGTIDIKMMAYYWFLVENGFSILISGGTASGKTSLLNVLSLFIKPQMKIVSIEDTAELRIPHAHWLPEVARSAISEEGKVDMFELLRESLRQRPDYIIVGEVRGREAYVLFQQMATGHPGLSTIHAENFMKLMDRLTTPPISLPPSLIQNLDAIIFVKRIKQGRKYVRKVSETDEIMGYDTKDDAPIVNELFSWDPFKDRFTISNKSGLLKKISNNTGQSASEIQENIRKKASVLEWLLNQRVSDYKKVSSVINLYYMSPDFLLERIGNV